jgi:methylmalonyl-CoA/ethylmalonyl-CoA epimerase
MEGKLNHIAIAVPCAEKAAQTYAKAFNAQISKEHILPDHGVKVVFVDMCGIRFEFLEPLNEASPISKFLQKNPKGGIHHVCFETPQFEETLEHIKNENGDLSLLNNGVPKIGAHLKPVVFLNPSSFEGVLLELEKEVAL